MFLHCHDARKYAIEVMQIVAMMMKSGSAIVIAIIVFVLARIDYVSANK